LTSDNQQGADGSSVCTFQSIQEQPMEMNPLVRPGLIGAAALAARLAFAQQASAPAPGAGAGMGSEPVQNSGGVQPSWTSTSRT